MIFLKYGLVIWLIFLVSGGLMEWICNGENRFYISQNILRKYILEKILRKMDSNYPIFIKKNKCCYFAIQSKNIVSDIKLFGGTKDKSKNSKFPIIPKEYLPDFVRGYFDGDGCICKVKDKRRTENSGVQKFNYVVSFTSGSKYFIESLLYELRNNINEFCGYIQKKKPKNKIANGIKWNHDGYVYVLICGINDARRIKSYMYNGSDLRIEDKYNNFDGIGEVSSRYLKQKFVSFKEAKEISLSLKLNKCREWKPYAKTKDNLPINPQKVYKNKGWNGWNDFLGN